MLASPITPVQWQDDKVHLIDQTRLPGSYEIIAVSTYAEMATAIKTMIVRGAPAIGVAAAYGMYLGAREIKAGDRAPKKRGVVKQHLLNKATRNTID